MNKIIFCTAFLLVLCILPYGAKTNAIPSQVTAVKRAALIVFEKPGQTSLDPQKNIDSFTRKVFKNTTHSIEGSVLKIGQIIALFVLCGLGSIVLLFALI